MPVSGSTRCAHESATSPRVPVTNSGRRASPSPAPRGGPDQLHGLQQRAEPGRLRRAQQEVDRQWDQYDEGKPAAGSLRRSHATGPTVRGVERDRIPAGRRRGIQRDPSSSLPRHARCDRPGDQLPTARPSTGVAVEPDPRGRPEHVRGDQHRLVPDQVDIEQDGPRRHACPTRGPSTRSRRPGQSSGRTGNRLAGRYRHGDPWWSVPAGGNRRRVRYTQFVGPNAVLIPGSTGAWNCVEVATTARR